MVPTFVAEKRRRKADLIARHLDALGIDARHAAHLSEDERRTAEDAVGTHKGSDLTWRVVVEMLAGSRRTPCLTCGLGDPLGDDGPPKPWGHPGNCAH